MTLPGFEILEKLGQGGTATVWKARQLSLDRLVAIKVLSARFSVDADDVARFQSEAQAAAKLKHPSMVQIYDANIVEGVYYYVMEFIAGYTVGTWLRRSKTLSEKDALLIAECVAKALQYAWEKESMIHCDIKPDNIMVDSDGTIKVADLGLSRTLKAIYLATQDSGESRDIMGTPAFMSPEQARGDDNLDCRTDIYALGATLYALVTGKMLFEGHGNEEVLNLQIEGHVEHPGLINPQLSFGFCSMIEAMLAKDPAKRPSSWTETIAEIDRVRRRQPLKHRLKPGEASTIEPAPIRKSSPVGRMPSTAPFDEPVASHRWGLWVAIGASALLLAILSGRLNVRARTLRESGAPRPREPVTTTRPSPDDARAGAGAGDSALAKRLEDIREWAANHPERRVEAILKFHQLAQQTRGTAIGQAAHREAVRIRDAHNQAIAKVMEELERQAESLAAGNAFQEAADIYRRYQGSLAEETAAARDRKAAEIDARHRVWQEAEAERNRQGDARLRRDLAEIAGMLLTQSWRQALEAVNAYLADAPTENYRQGMRQAAQVIAEAIQVDERILESFRAQRGREINVSLRARVAQIVIKNVTDGVVSGDLIRRDGSAFFAIPTTFRIEDLALNEILARGGQENDPGVPLFVGTWLFKSGAVEPAGMYFKRAPPPLGEFLIEQIRIRLNAQTAQTPPVEQASANQGAPQQDAVVPDPHRDGEGAEPQLDRDRRDWREVQEIAPFEKLVNGLVLSNPRLIVEESLRIHVDRDRRVRLLEIASPDLDSIRFLEGVEDMKDLVALYCGGVSIHQRNNRQPTAPLADLSPISHLRLQALYLGQTAVRELSPLKGMPLRELYLGGTRVATLDAIRQLPLVKLDIQRTAVRDLNPLRGMPLESLNVRETSVVDFLPLTRLPLRELDLSGTQFRDLNILRGMPLESLNLSNTAVFDFARLREFPLRRLYLADTQIKDISMLRGKPLEALDLKNTSVRELGVLRGMQLNTLSLDGTTARDFAPLQALPLRHLSMVGCNVDAIGWMREMPLKSLNMARTAVSDLSPLFDKTLHALILSHTRVQNLDALKRISVRHLDIHGLNVDLTPLVGKEIVSIALDNPENHLRELRQIRGLERVNGLPLPELMRQIRRP